MSLQLSLLWLLSLYWLGELQNSLLCSIYTLLQTWCSVVLDPLFDVLTTFTALTIESLLTGWATKTVVLFHHHFGSNWNILLPWTFSLTFNVLTTLTVLSLGEKPDPSDYFKSSSCPKLQRQPVTPAISTAAMDSTNTDLRHGPLNPEPMATENQDPSKSSPFVTGSPAMTTCGGMFLVPPAPMSSTTENRPRHRVGRNLLGATQSSSPLSPRYFLFSSLFNSLSSLH